MNTVGLTDKNATSTKHILETIGGHWQPRSNEIVAVTAYNQLVHGDLALPEYIEKFKEVTAVYNSEAAYNKCLWISILLGLKNQWVYEKCVEIGDKPTSADMIHIVTDIYNSDRQLSIMQSLSATTTAATAVKNLSVSELHVVKQGTAKRDQVQRTEVQATQARKRINPAATVEQHHHTLKRTTHPRMLYATSVRRWNTLRAAASPGREKRTWEY